jgi:secreted protein with Ig-like and vWFA domain
VGIHGKAPPPEDSARPANRVFLVDTSGSMNAVDRLRLAQQVLRQTLDLLKPAGPPPSATASRARSTP